MSKPERALIINADDLGYDPAVTRGILRAMHEGIVSSATLMVNTPYSEAAAHEARGLPIGLHFNLARGLPVWSAFPGELLQGGMFSEPLAPRPRRRRSPGWSGWRCCSARRPRILERHLATLPQEGVTELMCHPGYTPEAVRGGCTRQPEMELATVLHPRARLALTRLGVKPADFRVLTRAA